MTSGVAGASRGRMLALGLLVAWAALLATGILDPPSRSGNTGSGLFDLRSRSALWSAVVAIVTWAALEVLRYAPLGLLAVFAFLDRPRRLARVLLVALPAVGLALALAVLALNLEARGRAGPVRWRRHASPGPDGGSTSTPRLGCESRRGVSR